MCCINNIILYQNKLCKNVVLVTVLYIENFMNLKFSFAILNLKSISQNHITECRSDIPDGSDMESWVNSDWKPS